jgi:hypothetical protein
MQEIRASLDRTLALLQRSLELATILAARYGIDPASVDGRKLG